MAFLSEKVQEEIQNDLREIIINKLLNGFTDRKERPVVDVEAVNIYNLDFDEKNSDRDNIIITIVHSSPRVWIKNDDEGGKSNDNFQLRNTKPITFSFDNDSNKYVVQNEDEIVFFNNA